MVQNVTGLLPVIEALEALDVAYHVGGSVASSVHGFSRPTQDFDLVAQLTADKVASLVAALGDSYYANEASILDSLAHRRSFNLIAFSTGDKIDVFPSGAGERDQAEMSRSQAFVLSPGTRPVPVSSAEDIVVRKLEWYRAGGGLSERQWQDILGVLKIQGSRFDVGYARKTAETAGVEDLLDRALVESGYQA
jgi:hypothetical protein